MNPAGSPEGLLGSIEEPNLNPAASPEGLLGSIEEPNLNPAASPEGLLESADAPNLKPVEDSPEGLLGSTEAPNLNPPVDSGLSSAAPAAVAAAALTPNLNSLSDGFFSAAPTPNLKAAIAGETVGFEPGRGVSQEVHWVVDSGFRTKQVEHSHWVAAILNLSPNPWVAATAKGLLAAAAVAAAAAAGLLAPGFGVSQAAHMARVSALLMQQTEQLHVPEAGLNLSPKPWVNGFTASVLVSAGLLAPRMSMTLPPSFSSALGAPRTSMTLPVFNAGAGDSCLGAGGGVGDLDFSGLTFSGERKAKNGGVEVLAA